MNDRNFETIIATSLLLLFSACTSFRSQNSATPGASAISSVSPAPAVTPAPLPSQPASPQTLTRGRVKIVNHTLVADDGSLLRMVHGYVHDFVYSFYTDVNWWRQMHDIGHFNVVRVMAFLGSWPNSTQTMDVATLQARLDIMVKLASQTGMYVLIDNHSECCGAMNESNDINFWNAIASRYAQNTNVIYELKNEPDYWNQTALAGYENRMFKLIRSQAPETHIIAWTISQPLDIQNQIMGMFAQGNEIDYSNATVGLHPYNASGNVQGLLELYDQIRKQYPIIMTEVVSDGGSGAPPLSFINTMESMGISWGLLEGQGFKDAATNTVYGWVGATVKAVQVNWPAD